MPTCTVDISESSRQLLSDLAAKTGQSTTQVLEKALAAYQKQVFFDKLNAGYAELRADSSQWSEHEAERTQLDAANLDGLDADETWTDEGRASHG